MEARDSKLIWTFYIQMWVPKFVEKMNNIWELHAALTKERLIPVPNVLGLRILDHCGGEPLWTPPLVTQYGPLGCDPVWTTGMVNHYGPLG